LVANTNDPPQFTSTPITEATEGVHYSYTITTTDLDAGDSRTIVAPTLPDWLKLVDQVDGAALLSGTPAAGDVGANGVALVVTDEEGASNSQSFTILVAEENGSVDKSPPTPDPIGWDTTGFEWRSGPVARGATTVVMQAMTAVDVSGGVEYYFEETSGNAGGDDSGWQTSPVYQDDGLSPSTTYTYRVKTRDPFGNEGGWSVEQSVTTTAEWHICVGANCYGPVTYDEALGIYYANALYFTGNYNSATGECLGLGCDEAEQATLDPPVWYVWFAGVEYGPYSYDSAVYLYYTYAASGWRNSATGESGGAGTVLEDWHVILSDGNENGPVDVGPVSYDTALELNDLHFDDVIGWYNASTGDCEGAGCDYVGSGGEADSTPQISPVAAKSAWRNPFNRFDVDRDGNVVPLDVLAVVNEVNAPSFSDPSTGLLPTSRPSDANGSSMFDVNGDGFVTPLDVLALVNRINRGGSSQPATGGGASPLPLPPGTPASEFIPPALNGGSVFAPGLRSDQSTAGTLGETGQGEQDYAPADQPLPPAAWTAPFGSRSHVDEPEAELESVLDEIAADVLNGWNDA
jgi:hypothetical protein